MKVKFICGERQTWHVRRDSIEERFQAPRQSVSLMNIFADVKVFFLHSPFTAVLPSYLQRKERAKEEI